ncbi:MAG: hypothetical protein AAFZ18_22810 [Myxococcota bacterium]
MGLPVVTMLSSPARERLEARLRRAGRPPRRPSGAVSARIIEAGHGTLRACVKTACLAWGLGEDRGASWGLLLGLPRAALSLSAAALFLGVGKVLSAFQTGFGLEAPGRALNPNERATLQRVFGDALDLEPLRVKEGPAGVASLTSRPFVHGHCLYLKSWTLTPPILVHEAVHFWQYQHGGADYMLESLLSQAFGRGYDWQNDVGAPWSELETEQQASVIEDAFRAGYFATGSFVVDGADLSGVLEGYVAELRAGRGAP